MPKIKLNEFDRTGIIANSAISNIVYIPIETSDAIPLLNKGKLNTLCDSVAKLKELFDKKLANNDTSRRAYNIACRLLELGFQVIAEGIKTAEDDNVTKIPDNSLAALKDKSIIDVRFLTRGFIDCAEQLVAVAESRRDCIALIDLDEEKGKITYNEQEVELNTYDIDAIRQGFETHKSIYAAGFTPWFISNNSTLINGVTETVAGEGKETANPTAVSEVSVPASYGYLFAYARMVNNNTPEWMAVAGPERGIIPELTDVCYTYSYADVEQLQARSKENGSIELDGEGDNVGVAINPIAWVRPNGYIIYGNRTLKENTAAEKTTAQSFLNVRNGVNAIKKTLYEAGRRFTFEQNTALLWTKFSSYVTPLLERMQNNNGLLGYKLVQVATTAKARLRARLTIIPVEAVEDFEIDVYLVNDLTQIEE